MFDLEVNSTRELSDMILDGYRLWILFFSKRHAETQYGRIQPSHKQR